MNITDLITILGNISQSLYPVQKLITGFSYVLGIFMIMTALKKFKKLGGGSGSQEKSFVPTAYLLGGATLLFFPSTIKVLSGTAFGPENILSYGNYSPLDIHSVMSVLIKTIGIVWFIRGTILLTQASAPGVKNGSKGLVFIISGILATNFEATGAALSSAMDYVSSATSYLRSTTGY